MAAQSIDPYLMREVLAVRAELSRSKAALTRYTWIEHTEVYVKGKLKSSVDISCRYDEAGRLTKNPYTELPDKPTSKAISNRPLVRSKGEMQDYIERAISRIQDYVPPKPEQIDHLLMNGKATITPPNGGIADVRLTHYYLEGDSLVFTYDTTSKLLLRAVVTSMLGGPKDPVKLEAVFETLPGGISHLSTANLTASAKKVQVKLRNFQYEKRPD
jgi:hypothetical protein